MVPHLVDILVESSAATMAQKYSNGWQRWKAWALSKLGVSVLPAVPLQWPGICASSGSASLSSLLALRRISSCWRFVLMDLRVASWARLSCVYATSINALSFVFYSWCFFLPKWLSFFKLWLFSMSPSWLSTAKWAAAMRSKFSAIMSLFCCPSFPLLSVSSFANNSFSAEDWGELLRCADVTFELCDYYIQWHRKTALHV